jgi:hypothetical protein
MAAATSGMQTMFGLNRVMLDSFPGEAQTATTPQYVIGIRRGEV